jgi:hypothetical protein
MISSLESEEGLIEHSKGRFEHAVKFMRNFLERTQEKMLNCKLISERKKRR